MKTSLFIIGFCIIFDLPGFGQNNDGGKDSTLLTWPSEVPQNCPLAKFAGLDFTGRYVNLGNADTWYEIIQVSFYR